MTALDKAIDTLNSVERTSAEVCSPLSRLDIRGRIIVTVLYLVALLSLPLDNIAAIILFALYPLAGCAMGDIPYGRVMKMSLYTLPFIAFIGIFNPIFDRMPVLTVGSVTISQGWIQFASIILRGLLSVQATLLLILTGGFVLTCRGLRRLCVPGVFVTQLFLVYRYIFVLLQEAQSMQRARAERGYGRRSYGMKMWATFTGQLLIRTTLRAERIHSAMLARGFAGSIEFSDDLAWRWSDTAYLLVWTALFAAGRFCDVPAIFNHLA